MTTDNDDAVTKENWELFKWIMESLWGRIECVVSDGRLFVASISDERPSLNIYSLQRLRDALKTAKELVATGEVEDMQAAFFELSDDFEEGGESLDVGDWWKRSRSRQGG